MVKYIFWASLLVMMGLIAGCVNVDAKAPKNIPYVNASPAPSGSIAKANPSSKGDLIRENQQLRDRIAWLEEQNAKSAKKSRDLKNDKQDIQGDIDKVAAERDRYKRALGQ
jgi:hypothetical protein